LYIDDVFSTWLYTGNNILQDVNLGIDLSGKGGMVWLKRRNGTADHYLFDTNRGPLEKISSNDSVGQQTLANSLTNFNSLGFTLGSNLNLNAVNNTYASWTFRKAEKFFDVVTYTGTGANRTVAHNLGSVPGMIIVKRTDTTGNWQVYHRANTANPETDYLVLNSTAASVDSNTRWNDTLPTSTVFSLGTEATVNASGGTYVAYLFAHDAGGFGEAEDQNVVSCGSYVGNASVAGPEITLGYEPQFVMIKRATGVGSWQIMDNIRGMPVTFSTASLQANTLDAESGGGGLNHYVEITATGFKITVSGTEANASGSTYIYLAIRRPNKPPTIATEVFNPITYTGTNVDNRLVNTGILTDMTLARIRSSYTGFNTADRLRGNANLITSSMAVENTDADSFMTPTVGFGNSFAAMNGFGVGNDASRQLNQSSTAQLAYAFKRAPKFFDVVCYTGTGISPSYYPHNLTVIPELTIIKRRTATLNNWRVATLAGIGNQLVLNSIAGFAAAGTNAIGVTATALELYGGADTSASGGLYVAYLFATLSGISKVGSYTGTAATLQIDCGFTTGARFVLIKATSAAGDWYVWDTERGIVSGNDPYLLFNITNTEVTTTDWVNPLSSGFELSNTAGNFVNSSGASYIFLAIA
jgi:hypothetical protein